MLAVGGPILQGGGDSSKKSMITAYAPPLNPSIELPAPALGGTSYLKLVGVRCFSSEWIKNLVLLLLLLLLLLLHVGPASKFVCGTGISVYSVLLIMRSFLCVSCNSPAQN